MLCARKIYWLVLAKDIIFSKAYTITSLSSSKVIGNRKRILNKVRGCRYRKLIDFIYNNSRYRYHKNLIINNGFLLLVGIADCFAARGCSFSLPEQCDLFIESSSGCYACAPIFPLYDSDSNVLLRLTFLIVRMHALASRQLNTPSRDCHASLRLSCSCRWGIKALRSWRTQATPAWYHISGHNFNLDILHSYGSDIGNAANIVCKRLRADQYYSMIAS